MALCTAVRFASFAPEVENGTSSRSRVAQAVGSSTGSRPVPFRVQVLERATGLQGSHLSGRDSEDIGF